MFKQNLTRLLWIPILALVACTPGPAWVKPGATQNDFAKDKYDCMQRSQQRVSKAYVNAYGGASTDKAVTNESLFNACMNSQGWTLQSHEAIQQSAAQNRQIADTAKFKYQTIIDGFNSYCTNPDFDAFYKKASCNPVDASFAQLTDNTKATATQKKALDSMSPLLKQSNRDLANWFRSYGGQKGGAKASVIDATYEIEEKNFLNLYTGKITWGDFNSRRKEIFNDRKARLGQLR